MMVNVFSSKDMSNASDKKIVVGISSCLLGDSVRFDGGHKRFHFAVDELSDYFEYRPTCPEMAIGLPTPRPALRLVKSEENSVRLKFSNGCEGDLTEKMVQFAAEHLGKFFNLNGYIVCKNSPSCGLERVRVYDFVGNGNKRSGIGLFTEQLLKMMPWLPVEEDGRLSDPHIRENFIIRVFALHELNEIRTNSFNRHSLIDFHARYKLLLLAHSQPLYRELGRFVARNAEWKSLDSYFDEYRNKLMSLLQHQATRRNHTNVLMHIQGYFKRHLTSSQRQALSKLILEYRQGTQPLLAPITLITHYLSEYPDNYLNNQKYFHPYPQALRLRYGL
ncbi:YbgA family protein [Providencia vermicola]|uniref:YbgA family protein n=1 Tax=Providencia TaxID=586 RepID=UPI003D81960B